MTRVTFYKVGGDLLSAMRLGCQLAQKGFAAGGTVLCQTADAEASGQLDKLLWEFQQESFLPHGVGADAHPIAVNHQQDPGEHHQLLINLSHDVPTWFGRFERVIEITCSEPDYEKAKRESFRFYRERGYPLEFHDLSDRFA